MKTQHIISRRKWNFRQYTFVCNNVTYEMDSDDSDYEAFMRDEQEAASRESTYEKAEGLGLDFEKNSPTPKGIAPMEFPEEPLPVGETSDF